MKQQRYEFSIYRYNPDDDKGVYKKNYTLEVDGDLMLLGALEKIKDDLDPTLSFRRGV